MYGQDPRDAIYAALMRGDYSAITEDPRIPVESPTKISIPGADYLLQRQAEEMEAGIPMPSPAYTRGVLPSPIPIPNGRGMVSQATQAGDAAIPQRTNEYKIDAPTFAAAFRRMAELGAPEGVVFTWYVNGKPKGEYKYEYAGSKKSAPAKAKMTIPSPKSTQIPPYVANPLPQFRMPNMAAPEMPGLSPLQIDEYMRPKTMVPAPQWNQWQELSPLQIDKGLGLIR